MQQGNLCPRCQRPLRFIPQYNSFYCDFCHSYPFSAPPPWPYFPQKKDDTKLILMVVALIIFIFVILPIIAAAIMFFTFGNNMDGPQGNPTGAFSFTQTSPGNYTGSLISLTDRVRVDDAILTISDDSLGETASVDPLGPQSTVAVADGMSCSYSDANANGNLDAGDVFRVQNGAFGDEIRLIHIPTGALIAQFTLR